MKRRTECALCGVLVRKGTGRLAVVNTKRGLRARRVCPSCARVRCVLVAIDTGRADAVNARPRRSRSAVPSEWLAADGPGDDDEPRGKCSLHGAWRGHGWFMCPVCDAARRAHDPHPDPSIRARCGAETGVVAKPLGSVTCSECIAMRRRDAALRARGLSPEQASPLT